MSKYVKSTTETIIQTLIKAGHSITYSADGHLDKNPKWYISLNDDPAQVSGRTFEELNENFIKFHVGISLQSQKRIDGACAHFWHDAKNGGNEMSWCPECPLCKESVSEEIKCPGCQQEITPENAGGYRTFCADCIKLFPEFPKDGKGYTIEVNSVEADAGLKQTIFKWIGGCGVEPIEPWLDRE